jgi:thioesterase domain-containing protein
LYGYSALAESVHAKGEKDPQLTTAVQTPNADIGLQKSPLVAIRAGGSRPPLFCIPGIAGTLVEFHDLAARLSADQPVYGLQPLGTDGPETPHDSIVAMATCYLREIRSRWPHGPYYLAGYSLGGAVAFEMARQIEAEREPVGALILLDSQLWGQRLPLSTRIKMHWQHCRQRSLAGRWRYLASRFRSMLARWWRRARHADDDGGFDRRVLGAMRAYCRRSAAKAPLPGTNLSYAQLLVIKSHFDAFRSYRPAMYHGPITLFSAADHPTKGTDLPRDATLGWSCLTTDEVEVHVTPGAHLHLLNSPNLEPLAARLQACLDRAYVK